VVLNVLKNFLIIAHRYVDSRTCRYVDTRTFEEAGFERADFARGLGYVCVPSHVPNKAGRGLQEVGREAFVAALLSKTNSSRSVKVVLACQAGVRSKRAAQWLVESGWEGDIVELADGFAGWKGAGLPTAK